MRLPIIEYLSLYYKLDHVDKFISNICRNEIPASEETFYKVCNLSDYVLDVIGHLVNVRNRLQSMPEHRKTLQKLDYLFKECDRRYYALEFYAFQDLIWCNKCFKHKEIIYFNILSSNYCKECMKNKSKEHYENTGRIKKKEKYDANPSIKIEYQKKYSQENKEAVVARRKAYYEANRERLIAEQIERDKKRDPKEKAAYGKEYREKNRDRLVEQKKQYLKKIGPKLSHSISGAINAVLRTNGGSHEGKKYTDLIGYSTAELIAHIEVLFSHPDNLTPDGKVWMTWQNRGVYTPKTWNDNDPSTWKWQLDHIKSQSKLKFNSLE